MARADAAATARALKAAGRLEEALQWHRRDVAARPGNAVALHNLAATLGDLSHFAEAAEVAETAIAGGGAAPETMLVHARALQGLMQLDAAERAYARAVRARPGYIAALRDWVQLRWMRGGDLAQALVPLDDAANVAGAAPALAVLRARLHLAAGDARGALAVLDRAIRANGSDAELHLAAVDAAAQAGETGAQLNHAVAALRAQPASAEAAKAAATALLAQGRAEEARDLALRIAQHHPHDQGVHAVLHTAWRLLGDPRGSAAYGDERLIRRLTVPTPAGWPSREQWLADLAAALRARHGWRAHPVEQSLRFGSQTQEDLSRAGDPPVAALFAGIRPLVDQYTAELGPGADPVRARAAEVAARGWRFVGAWSVLLRPGGFHVDHVHPQGWLSSALHVEAPPATAQAPQGWLSFGRPGIATRPPLPPVQQVQPVPGQLVLFPSHCWHGTEPFDGEDGRLSVAFDIVPA